MKKETQAIIAEAKAEIKADRRKVAVMTAKEILEQIELCKESTKMLQEQLEKLGA